MLITDPTFAAGVVSQKNRVHGTLKGQGHAECLVDYVQNEEPVEVGRMVLHLRRRSDFPQGLSGGTGAARRETERPSRRFMSPPAGCRAAWRKC